jgi:hypothetical protein
MGPVEGSCGMSETERWQGKLLPIDTSDGLEETIKRICEDEGWKPCYDGETWLEVLQDDGYRKYFVQDGNIYAVKATELDDDIFQSTLNEDGTISFVVSYYNGGCSFNGAIKEALKNMQEELEDEKDKGMEEMAVSEEEG